MNNFSNSPFAAFNPFMAGKNNTGEPKPADAFTNPLGANLFGSNPFADAMKNFKNPFDMSSIQQTMQSAMPKFDSSAFSGSQNAAGDLFKNWQKACQNLMGDFSDNLHNPSGPFGSVAPDSPVNKMKEMAGSMMAGMTSNMPFSPSSKIGSIDWTALAAAQKKNMEALTTANHAAMAGMQQIMKRQSDIFRETMQTAGQLMTDLMATGTPEEKLARQADIALRAVNISGKHMRELAELATQSQHEALDVVEGRLKDSLDEMKQAAKASGAQYHDDVTKAEAAKKTAQKAAKDTAKSYAKAADSMAADAATTISDTLN